MRSKLISVCCLRNMLGERYWKYMCFVSCQPSRATDGVHSNDPKCLALYNSDTSPITPHDPVAAALHGPRQ